MKSFLFLFTVLSASMISDRGISSSTCCRRRSTRVGGGKGSTITSAEPESCQICCDNLSSPELMSCGKTLCSECLMKTLDAIPENAELRCPFCRVEFTIEFLQDLAQRRGARVSRHVQNALKSHSEKMLERKEFDDALQLSDSLVDDNTRSQIQAFALASLGRLDEALDTGSIQAPWKYFKKHNAIALALKVVERCLESSDKSELIQDVTAIRNQQIWMLMELKRYERVLEVIQEMNSHRMNILRATVLGSLNRVSEAFDEIERAASQEGFSDDFSESSMGLTNLDKSVFNACMSVLQKVSEAGGGIELGPEIMAVQRFPENKYLRSCFVKNIYRHQNHGRFFLVDLNRERLVELIQDGYNDKAKQLANLLVRDDQKAYITVEARAVADIFAKEGEFVKAIQILDVVILLDLDVEELQKQKERLQNKD